MKILPCGVAVLENDTHISKWVEQSGTLAIAERMIHPFAKWIPAGGVVVDAGAMIGDHTVTYARLVGSEGCVHAFEPQPEAFACLLHNMKHLPQVMCWGCALSDKAENHQIVLSDNVGASHLVPEKSGDSHSITLDSLGLQRLDYMKIDVEGYECRVLRGALETIKRCRPAILCEVNSGSLERAGFTQAELFGLFYDVLKYSTKITGRENMTDPQFDIFCLPRA